MMTPTIVLVLLLLGFTQASIITYQSGGKPNKPFELSFDPGFEVRRVTVGRIDIPRCSNIVKEQCYEQEVEHAAHIIIADKTLYTTAQFVGNTVLPQTSVKISKLEPEPPENQPPPPPSNRIDNSYYTLKYVPTKMVLTKTTPPGGTATEELLVSDGCPGKKPAIGCINMVKGNYQLSLTLATTPNPLIISLESVDGHKKEITFGVNSASTWLPGWVAVILTNMATVYLVQ
ncbi:unnamed protein product [Dibothriocephalus latus]|uniref:Uncharacterized protein n=1 Tax=Dibothriocephalus latus TaxID=60516 RepID=A0A3P7M6X8_DIBLA|nr:unnamed protein product [Dibothriocephalus latus]